MKTLMTFAAVAALVSGVSIASAQMQNNNITNSKSSAENGKFCQNINGSQSCRWNSMAECQKEAQPNGDCFPSGGKPSTTGAAAGGAAKPMNAAPSGSTANSPTTNSLDKGAQPTKGK